MILADEQVIKVDPANEEWIELWTNYKEESGLPRFRGMSDEEIAAALEQVK